jgi:hypothetical protein
MTTTRALFGGAARTASGPRMDAAAAPATALPAFCRNARREMRGLWSRLNGRLDGDTSASALALSPF